MSREHNARGFLSATWGVLGGACLAAMICAASAAHAAPSNTIDTTIAQLENGWFGEGMAVILNNVNVSGCGPGNEFGVKTSHPNFAQISSLLISAKLSGRTVQIVYEPTSCVFGNRKELLSVRLK
jgi:ABC-type sugar transport system substrate-binding protein